MKEFKYTYNEYNKNTGVLYETDKNMIVKLSISNDTCFLSANKEGLVALAKSLLNLADDSVPSGCHFHLDAPVFMEEESSELMIEKI